MDPLILKTYLSKRGFQTWKDCFELIATDGDDKHAEEKGLHDEEDRVKNSSLSNHQLLQAKLTKTKLQKYVTLSLQ